MLKIIPTGNDDFKKLIETNMYYVDKTLAIEEIIKNNTEVALFPRPRRFGKTLFISMLDNFFNIERKESNKNLFDNLNISKSEYYKYFGSYPVIKLNFKSLKHDDYEVTYGSFKEMIRQVFNEKIYLLEILNEGEKKLFNSFLEKNATIDEYHQSIKLLSDYLYRYYNKKVIVLIDEYDVPIQQGYLHGFYDDIIKLIRGVFSNSLKSNENIQMSVMTGVLRVSKESMFSDLNNVEVYSIVNKEYNEYFGFTTEETKELLEHYGLSLTNDVKEMYDGYNFNGIDIYNPWSILNYAKRKELDNYWANTSGNELLMSAMEVVEDEIKLLIESLISGNSIPFTYDDKVTYLDISTINSITGIINFFLQSGYLTIDSKYGFNINNLYAKIPNNEIRSCFALMLNRLIDKTVVNGDYLLKLLKNNLLINNKEKVEEILNKLLVSLSFYDTKENFYHGYVLGIFSGFLSENYVVKSNRESGSGRFDVMIISSDRKFGYIFELKITDKDMENTAKNALEQMKEKEYYKELLLEKVDSIYEYAIVFKGKKCIVR